MLHLFKIKRLQKASFVLLGIFFLSVLSFQDIVADAAHSADPCPTHTPDEVSTKLGGYAWNTYLQWMSQSGTYKFKYTEGGVAKEKTCTYRVYRKGTGRVLEKGKKGEVVGWSYLKNLGYYACWGKTCSGFAPGGIEPEVALFRKDILNPNGDVVSEKIVAKGLIRLSFSISGDEKDRWICLDPDALGLGSTLCRTGKGASYSVGDYEVVYDEKTNEFSGRAWSYALGWFTFSGRIYEEKRADICRGPSSDETADKIFYRSLPATFRERPEYAHALSDRSVLNAALIKWQGECTDNITNISFNSTIGKARWNTFYIGPGTRVRHGSAYSEGGFRGNAALSEVDYLIYTKNTLEDGKDAIVNWTSRIKNAPGSIDESSHVGSRGGNTNGSGLGVVRTKPLPDTKGKVKLTLPKVPPPKSGQQTQQQTSNALIRSRVGALNINALTTLPDVPGKKNKYGFEVINLSSGNLLQQLCGGNYIICDLKGRVFFYDGDLVLSKDTIAPFIRFTNSAKRSGGGTIIVRGDLTFGAPLYYDATSGASSFNKLASVAWVVLKKSDGTGGNIIIGDCIPDFPGYSHSTTPYASLVGVFLAEGKIVTGTGKYDTTGKRNADFTLQPISADEQATRDCKDFDGELPLVVNGIMVAKEFQLERLYGGVDIGSEEIIYDGRLIANIPPGLEDVVKSLPKSWR